MQSLLAGSNPAGDDTFLITWKVKISLYKKVFGPVRDSNPRPLAPKARIIPLDQLANRPLWSLNFSICDLRPNNFTNWTNKKSFSNILSALSKSSAEACHEMDWKLQPGTSVSLGQSVEHVTFNHRVGDSCSFCREPFSTVRITRS